MELDEWLEQNLVCPRDHGRVQATGKFLTCPQDHRYPYVDGIPVMLLQVARTSHRDYLKTLRALSEGSFDVDDAPASEDDGVDPYVQLIVAATCGIMYKPLINRLTRYPIPDFPMPEASQQYLLGN